MSVNNRFVRSLVVLLILSLAVYLGLSQVAAPEVNPKSAPDVEFSAERALEHVEKIAQKPHPTGSPEAYAVRDYLIDQLKALGLSPEVQEGAGARLSHDMVFAGSVQNVIARLKGTGEGKAIMIAAHYDSVPTAPGASDDGAAVGAMLETLRALQAGPQLKHDVIFLFTDGEELGLVGADLFTAKHPWMKDIGLVLNFEARGYTGPSFMFETSDQNGWLMKEFAEAAEHPVANSMLYDMYKLMPNDTDLTAFKQAGLSGLNFAYAIGLNAYHNTIDSVEQLDRKSLQHHGSYMLSLTKHLGNLDSLEDTKETNRVYFNVLKHTLVGYSQTWVLPLAIAVTLLFLYVLIAGIRRDSLQVGGLLKGFFAFLLAIVVTGAVTMGAWMLLSALQSDLVFNLTNDPDFSDVYAWGFALLAIAVFALLYAWFRRFTSVGNLTGGAIIWVWLLMIATVFLLPGGSYLFTWPLFFSLIGWHLLIREREGKIASLPQAIILTLLAVPAVVLFSPIVYLVQVLVSLQLAGVIFALQAIMMGLLIPQILSLMDVRPLRFPIAAVAGSLAVFLISAFALGVTEKNPTLVSLLYGKNDDTNKAVFATASTLDDPWLEQFLSAEPEKGPLNEILYPLYGRDYRYAEAPGIEEKGPKLETISDEKSGDVRTITVKLTSQRQAGSITVTTETDGKLLGGKVFDRAFDTSTIKNPGGPFVVDYGSAPETGLLLTLKVQAASKVTLSVIDTKYGYPSVQGKSYTDSPKSIMAVKRVVVSKKFEL